MTEFARWLLQLIDDLFGFLLDLFSSFFKWLFEGVLDILDRGLSPFLDPLVSAFEQIPDSVMYFLGFLEVPFGIACILSAYSIRFLIRRIPFFG